MCAVTVWQEMFRTELISAKLMPRARRLRTSVSLGDKGFATAGRLAATETTGLTVGFRRRASTKTLAVGANDFISKPFNKDPDIVKVGVLLRDIADGTVFNGSGDVGS